MTNATVYVQKILHVQTKGRGTMDISHSVAKIVNASQIDSGICHIFIQHTSASLIVCENADPAVRIDLETFMAKLVPDGDSMFVHRAEGPDDMPAHVRSIITQTGLSLPISNGALALGTWQGIYLWEHRSSGHNRRITVTAHGVERH